MIKHIISYKKALSFYIQQFDFLNFAFMDVVHFDWNNTFTVKKMELDDEIEGFRVVAESLKRLGVKYMFGVVGIPVVEVY